MTCVCSNPTKIILPGSCDPSCAACGGDWPEPKPAFVCPTCGGAHFDIEVLSRESIPLSFDDTDEPGGEYGQENDLIETLPVSAVCANGDCREVVTEALAKATRGFRTFYRNVEPKELPESKERRCFQCDHMLEDDTNDAAGEPTWCPICDTESMTDDEHDAAGERQDERRAEMGEVGPSAEQMAAYQRVKR